MRSDPDSSLSLSEVATRLRVTVEHVIDLIEEGQLRFAPTADIDDIRVPESALAEFLHHHFGTGRYGADGDT